MRKKIERLKIYPQPELIAAHTVPAMASPRACALLNGMPLAAMACDSSLRSTTSTAPEFHDGKSITMQHGCQGRPHPVGTAAPPTQPESSAPGGSASRSISGKTPVCASGARKNEPVYPAISQTSAVA